MLAKLILLFTVLPLVELVLLTVLVMKINFLPTLAIILLTGMIGAFLARRQGAAAWRRVRETLARGELPAAEMVDGVMILVAGALLVTPGIITDITGFLLLLPQGRAVIRRRLQKHFQARVHVAGSMGGFGPGGPADPTGPAGFGAAADHHRPASEEVIDIPADDADEPSAQPADPQARLHH